MPRQTNLIVALPSEARPIIDRFRLRHNNQADGVKIYHGNDMRLIVSGVGRIASAAAVGYIAGATPADVRHTWVNIGIAGHLYLPVGSVGLAHSIIDHASAKTYYPSIAFNPVCQTTALSCHADVTTTYAGEAMCDVESSGFFAAATHFADVEFIHCLKIVSDNAAVEIESLNRQTISALTAGQMDVIDNILACLKDLDITHHPSLPAAALDTLLERWHFTANQKLQLGELARRWTMIEDAETWPPWDALFDKNSARDVLASVRAILEKVPLQLRQEPQA